MDFLKIGNQIIAVSMIEAIVAEGECALVRLASGRTINTTAYEGGQILKYFGSPERCLLTGDEYQEEFLCYQSKGGLLRFADWRSKFDRHQRLCEIEEPSRSELHSMAQMEEELMF